MSLELIGSLSGVVGLVVAAFALYVRMSIRSALAEFELRLFERLNDKYVTRKEYDLTTAEMERRMTTLEEG